MLPSLSTSHISFRVAVITSPGVFYEIVRRRLDLSSSLKLYTGGAARVRSDKTIDCQETRSFQILESCHMSGNFLIEAFLRLPYTQFFFC